MNQELSVKLSGLSKALNDVKGILIDFDDELKSLDKQKAEANYAINHLKEEWTQLNKRVAAEKEELRKTLETEQHKIREMKDAIRATQIDTEKDNVNIKDKLAAITEKEKILADRIDELNTIKAEYSSKLDQFNKMAQSIR